LLREKNLFREIQSVAALPGSSIPIVPKPPATVKDDLRLSLGQLVADEKTGVLPERLSE
jgi:hypothetical protein